MTTAFVLSGGGSLGAVQAGQLRALAEHGIAPDLVVGASVGAVNGVYAAMHPGLDGAVGLERLWLSTGGWQVFPPSPLDTLLGVVGLGDHLVSNGPLRRLLERELGGARLERLPVPAHCVTTDVLSGRTVVLSRGRAADAVLASAAIPAVFPPVRVGSRTLMDGGTSDNTPLAEAIALGATRILVLPTGFACSLASPPRSALAMAVHALSVLVEARLINELRALGTEADITVLPPPCPLDVVPVDFSQSARLVEEGHRLAAAALGAGRGRRGRGHPAAVLEDRHRAHAGARTGTRVRPARDARRRARS